MTDATTPADYHGQTKHHYRSMARSLGYLDWATQPDPFRRYAGAPLIKLAAEQASPLDKGGKRGVKHERETPLSTGAAPCAYDDLFLPQHADPQPISFDSISRFFELSLAVSAWKQFGTSRWALRVNPSSGNLHPTEGYLVIGPIDDLHGAAAVYHYAPKEHGLERRTEFDASTFDDLMSDFPAGSFIVGLSSIHWREAWKYGERAYRYCQHDVGHALAALSVAAATQGWHLRPLAGVPDADITSLLGLDHPTSTQPEPRASARADVRHDGPPAEMHQGATEHNHPIAEREHSDLLAVVIPANVARDTALSTCLPRDVVARIAAGTWTGQANRLSADHVEWHVIEDVATVCENPGTANGAACLSPCQGGTGGGSGFPPYQGGIRGGFVDEPHDPAPPLPTSRQSPPADLIIRQRRSAQAMDAATSISADDLYLMLDRTMPRYDRAPFAALGPPTCVYLAIFVHRVDGLTPGLYFLCRRPGALDALKDAMHRPFDWHSPPGCPTSLPLYLLQTGDFRDIAARVSCMQTIASDGAFSLGMIAEFAAPLASFGPWFYRRLFWETGVIGQVLYLEAEAAGVRGTGIGCFFDDAVHDLLGLTGTACQSLYHFTVGAPVEDTRITTLPAYDRTSGTFPPEFGTHV